MNENEQANASSGERRAVSRRDFVANAALIGVGFAVAPLLACDRERPESSAPANGPTTAARGGSAETIRRAHAVQPVTAVQTEYSVMERAVEKNGVLAVCEELGIGFVPWGLMGMGYLTGKIDARTKLDPKTDLRSGFDRFTPQNLAANRPFVELLQRVGEQKNATPAQIALAWLLTQKPFIVPIPGTRNVDHLTENLGAAQVALTAAELREIETASAALKVHGGRMNEEQMKVDK